MRVGDLRVASKIDHMFCNEPSKDLIPHFQLDYEPPISSDHSPGILSVQLNNTFSPKHFIKGWMKHPKFKNMLLESWNLKLQENPQINLTKKLKKLKT